MKKSQILLGLAVLAGTGLVFIAADHIDAPAVTVNGAGTGADITDVYGFQAQNSSNLVLVANVKGLLSPAASASATFDENVLIEINIDNNGDAVEDFVIQAIPRDGKMYFFGPAAPAATGTSSTVLTNVASGEVDITAYGSNVVVATNNGMSFFAGPRDDPFFFDLGQFRAILGGTATGFNDPGTDTFAGTNVLSVVVEVPKAMLGSSNSVNIWAETKTKQ